MIPLTSLAAIATACGGKLLGPDSPATPSASIDSRDVVPGGIFCALPGERTDGHSFAVTALHNGAAAVLVSDPKATPARPAIVVDDVRAAMGRLAAHHAGALRHGLTLLAITGSAGKTTTKDLIAAALPGPTVATERSLNNEIGLPLTVLRATADTRYLVLEMGADREGDLTYLTSLVPPDVAVVLMVGRAHLGVFGSQEAVARAKGELVRGLAPGGTAVLNHDDARVVAMAKDAPGPVLTFGRGDGADVRAIVVEPDEADRARLTVEAGDERVHLRLGLAGEHHTANALAALAAALAVGVPLAEAAARIDGAGPASPHRMALSERNGVTVIDDAYNANPDSMAAALGALVRISAGRRTIAVLGEMRELGEAADHEHAALGARAAELAIGHVVVVGAGTAPLANPLGEAATVVADVAEARTALDELAQEGDVVLFKASNGTGLWRLAEEWRT
nr:UDP-N-acetylmuramoyl-tripeptide--D-alanyl-D-alanine ligase [Actinomycetales bacterium]